MFHLIFVESSSEWIILSYKEEASGTFSLDKKAYRIVEVSKVKAMLHFTYLLRLISICKPAALLQAGKLQKKKLRSVLPC